MSFPQTTNAKSRLFKVYPEAAVGSLISITSPRARCTVEDPAQDLWNGIRANDAPLILENADPPDLGAV